MIYTMADWEERMNDDAYAPIRTHAPHIIKPLMDYYFHGRPTGGFIKGILTNDLFSAAGRADTNSFLALKAICTFVFSELSAKCWGDEEAYNEWIEGDEWRSRIVRV